MRIRIAIIGSHRNRVSKVISLLQLEEFRFLCSAVDIVVEYIACVASFDFYRDESGKEEKYLAKLESFGPEGKDTKGSSLVPLFEELCSLSEKKEEKSSSMTPDIVAFAVGCGIEAEQDILQIKSFINALSAPLSIPERPTIHMIQPNDGFSSMNEENLFYKKLSLEDKANTIHVGPTKMANFVFSIANDMISCLLSEGKHGDEFIRDAGDENESDVSEEQKVLTYTSMKYEQSITRYSCKLCRTILFTENDLEDPPHVKNKHNFTHRKGQSSTTTHCQSLFLSQELNWMGDIGCSNEGKLFCPKCEGKIGLWNWSGTQCSCGTWVVPAIQIPLGRVDPILPMNESNQQTKGEAV